MPFFAGNKKEKGSPPGGRSPTNGSSVINRLSHNDIDKKKNSFSQQPPPPYQQSSKNSHDHHNNNYNNNENQSNPAPPPAPPKMTRPKLVFHCQQAQGSPTGLISGFSNVKELYQKISECYDFPVDDILFCTLNTHKLDMDNLLSAQLCLDDFIFVHRRGQRKEVEVEKTEDALGLTITDNGTGYAFIKRIKEDSIIDRVKHIDVGDHIEKIDDECLVGWRHVDVAKYLKGISVGQKFTLRLIEPLKGGFVNIGPKSEKSKSKNYGSGKETLRFRSNGTAAIEVAPDDFTQTAIDSINKLLENYMGINDSDLANQIWDLAKDKKNTMDFASEIDSSELESFGFTDDFLIEVWGIVTDVKSGRLNKNKSPNKYNNGNGAMDEDEEEDLSYLINSNPAAKANNRRK